MAADDPSRRSSAWRAALELLGAAVVATALLYAPFFYAAFRLDRALGVPPERVAFIEHANCVQLRGMVVGGSDSSAMLSPIASQRASQEVRLILERARQLRCSPPVRAPEFAAD